MKAALIRRKVTPERTHDLVRLSDRLAKAVTGWAWDPPPSPMVLAQPDRQPPTDVGRSSDALSTLSRFRHPQQKNKLLNRG
jgi:hypothetical protein